MTLRVLIVEDSLVMRELLVGTVDGDPRMRVVGAFGTAEEALERMPALRPDVVSLDIRLPGMDGFEATRWIMHHQPTPIVVVSGSVEREDLRISMRALDSGALSVVEKPLRTEGDGLDGFQRHLLQQLWRMSRVRVIRQTTPPRSPRPAAPAGPEVLRPAVRPTLVGIGTSTGGPGTVRRLLESVGPEFPVPVLLVQHLAPAFFSGFVTWLDEVTPFRVIAALDGARPEPATVHVAPPERHLLVRGGRLVLGEGPLIEGHRPAATPLFESMARDLGERGLGVVLTGMGSDGSEGLLRLRQAGGWTLAEDASAVVGGMPGAAVTCGAVRESLPVAELAARLRQLVIGPQPGARSGVSSDGEGGS